MKQPVITARHLTKSFGGKEVIHDCSLSVEQGSLYGLLGRNGAGKATLFKLLLGLQRPTAGTGAVLLFSYPVSRRRILAAKLCLVTGYTVCAVILCGGAVYGVFFWTEALAPICSDRLTLGVVLQSFGFLAVCAILAGLLSLLSLWIGFWKRSIPAAIVAAVILASVVCQVVSVALVFWPAGGLVMGAAALLSVLALKDLFDRVEKMEV